MFAVILSYQFHKRKKNMEENFEPKQLSGYRIDLQMGKLDGDGSDINLLNADVSGANLRNADLLELEWLSAETNLNSPE